jgi:nodulation protein E
VHRVVITGMGAVTPVGNTVPEFWKAVRAGQSGIGQIRQFDPSGLDVRIAAEVKGFDPADHLDRRRLGSMDRVSQLAVVAAREAAACSGLDFRGEIGLETSGVVGTGVGGEITLEQAYRRLFAEGAKTVHPFTVPKLMVNAPASHVSMDLGIRGPVYAVASACSSANHAMGVSFQLVRSGSVKVAVTGGSEACLSHGTMRGWEALRVLAKDTCRPFSRDRRGMVLGEGAGFFVFEDLEHARARGAEILAEVLGSGTSADAADLVRPSVEGAARALRAALSDARVDPRDVGYVNAHGTGTKVNDEIETEVVKQVFGVHARALAISSTKSMHGHSLGAAGALELAATVMALREHVLPPTANFTESDPACDLFCVPNEAIERDVRVAVSNSFAFGGLNAVLVIGSWQG